MARLYYQIGDFETHNSNRYLGKSLGIFHQVDATRPHWWLVNIGSGNGLVPSGNKPLSESMLTQIYVYVYVYGLKVTSIPKMSDCAVGCWESRWDSNPRSFCHKEET